MDQVSTVSPSEVPVVERPEVVPSRGRPTRWLRPIAALAGVLAVPVVFLGWSLARYASVEVGFAALRGEPVARTPSAVGLGTIRPGETARSSMTVWNLSSRPIELQGGRTNCGCVRLAGLPVTIPAHASRPIEVTVTPPASLAGPNEKTWEVLTNLPNRPSLRGSVRFDVTP